MTKKEKVLDALINTPTIAEASRKSGVSARTIYRYLNNNEFLSDYRKLRSQAVENSLAQLQRLTTKATNTLERNLNCQNPGIEVRTAQIVIENSIRAVEMSDILERLEKLENAN